MQTKVKLSQKTHQDDIAAVAVMCLLSLLGRFCWRFIDCHILTL